MVMDNGSQVISAEDLSLLDIWALNNYGTLADQLDPPQMDELITKVIDQADQDKRFWRPRDERMMDSQLFWELGSRYLDEGTKSRREKKSADEEPDEMASETVEFNDGYLTVDKITSMVEGAGWSLDVMPKAQEFDDIAQNIENALRWADEELDKRHGLSLHGTTNRDEVHYAALRGWITGMILPDPRNRTLPWKYVLEDPLLVFPRYDSNGLVRVTHAYAISGLEAKSEYPGAWESLGENEEETVEILSYHDSIYHMKLLLGSSGSMGGSGTPRMVLQPLVRHGYKDLDGRPINPWIIVTPRGSPTRRLGRVSSTSDQSKLVAYIGLDVLYPIKDILVILEKLASMQFTQIAKGVAPPFVLYGDGHNKPERLDIGTGAQNYMILGSEDFKVLDTTTMKPDAGPFMQLLIDRLQRGTIPSVLYGQAGFSLAGYAISLLSVAANDVVRPLLNGIKLYREIKYRRMLEMYVNVASQWAQQLVFPRHDAERDITYASGASLTPEDILSNGAGVRVSYDEVTARDLGILIPTVVGAVQAGLMPIYDAMKQIGIKDPRQALVRLAEGKNYSDPLVVKHLARLAGDRSGNELLKAAIQAARQEEQQLLAQAFMQSLGGGQEGAPVPEPGAVPQVGGGAVRSTAGESPPSATNPLSAAIRQMEAVTAENNVGAGGSATGGGTLRRRSEQTRRV